MCTNINFFFFILFKELVLIFLLPFFAFVFCLLPFLFIPIAHSMIGVGKGKYRT